jgi:SAM-dependent methyltransferase
MDEYLYKELRGVADYFDRHGDNWINAYQKDTGAWYEYNSLRFRMKHALALIQKAELGTAVDLGCGSGYALIMMKLMGFKRVTGIDISDRMLATARELLNKHGLANEVELYKADAQNLTMISSGSVDVCIALGLVEYLDDDEHLLREINRILTTGGTAIIQMRNHECIRSRTVEKLEKIKRLYHRPTNIIFRRNHKAGEFAHSARACGFEIKHQVYSHFYALYPFNLIPVFRKLLTPFDNFLSKKMERFSENRLARHLASMYIAKIQKVRNFDQMHGPNIMFTKQ